MSLSRQPVSPEGISGLIALCADNGLVDRHMMASAARAPAGGDGRPRLSANRQKDQDNAVAGFQLHVFMFGGELSVDVYAVVLDQPARAWLDDAACEGRDLEDKGGEQLPEAGAIGKSSSTALSSLKGDRPNISTVYFNEGSLRTTGL